ncbi:response regulator [Mucilaginibacter sp. CAU 1740]|uniref:response regulator n=1 Tax=Mucilaginibacter sp. CAU 1740 TaxID=3140365 RepID=UPI00325C15D4
MAVGSKKILVVDDDEDIREVMTMILETDGYTVFALDNGHEVLKAIQDNRPDVLLSDVRLGDMDGRDICRELKDNPTTRGIPISFVSATHGWHTMHEKKCGANDYVAKPFDVEDLLLHVRRLAA